MASLTIYPKTSPLPCQFQHTLTGMRERFCIFVFGQSLFMQAILMGLQQHPTIDAQAIDPRSPLLGTRLRHTRPCLLILEVGGETELLPTDLLAADIPILIVNIQSGNSKLMTGEPLPLVETVHQKISGLVALINQIEVDRSRRTSTT